MAQLRDLIVNGASRFLGVVNFNNETIFNEGVTLNETLTLLKETDAVGSSYTAPALVIGPYTAQHLEFDTNEIMSKSAAGTPTTLYLNNNGGQVVIGQDGLKVGDGTAATAKNTGDLQVSGGLSTTAASFFGAGVTVDSTLSVTGNTTIGNETSDVHKVTGNLTHNGIVYFANGTTYYINNSGNAKFNTLTSVGNTTLGDSATGDTIAINGVTTITGATKVVGTLTAQGNVVPSANNTYSLGSSGYKWKELYVNSIAYIGDGTAATNATNTGVLRVKGGLSASHHSYFNSSVTLDTLTIKNTSAIGHINFSRGNFNYITAPASGVIAFVVNGQGVSDTTSELIIKDGEIRPGTTNATSLGTSSYRWSNLYGVHLNIIGSSTLGDDAASDTHTIKGNTTLYGNFNPGTTIAYGLGSINKYWKNLYVGDGTAGAVSNTGIQTGSIVVNGGMSLTHDIAIKSENNDRAIKFVYGKSSSDGYGWQIKYSGTGADDANYLSIESSGTSGTYSPAVRFGLISLDAAFGGHIYPLANNTKNLGTSSYAWKNIYGYDYYIKNNAYFANGTTYKIDSSGHAVFNNTTTNGNLTVKGNTVLGDATSDTTTIKGAISITYDGTIATGSAATALSNMTGAIKVLNGGIVTNKDVAAQSFYVHDKARMQYDTTNDYVYFTFS